MVVFSQSAVITGGARCAGSRARTSPACFRCSRLALAWLAALPLAAQDVRVGAGTIEDRRTTGRFFVGLEIELKLTGDDLADAKSARIL